MPEDLYLERLLIESFPKPLQQRYSKEMQSHPLKREIIATKLGNIIVNEMGFSFIYRLKDETGASTAYIVRAYMIARSVLGVDLVWQQIEALDNKITAQHQSEIMVVYVRLLRRISRWFLRSQRSGLNISKAVQLYAPGVQELKNAMPEILGEGFRAQYDLHYNEYKKMGIPDALARELTTSRGLFAAMDVIDIAKASDITVSAAAEAYFGVGEFLDLGWIRTEIISHSTENHWESLSREALRDDLDWQQRQLTISIIACSKPQQDFTLCLTDWSEKHVMLIERWHQILSNLRSSSQLNYTMFFVAIRELLVLTQTTIQLSENDIALERA